MEGRGDLWRGRERGGHTEGQSPASAGGAGRLRGLMGRSVSRVTTGARPPHKAISRVIAAEPAKGHWGLLAPFTIKDAPRFRSARAGGAVPSHSAPAPAPQPQRATERPGSALRGAGAGARSCAPGSPAQSWEPRGQLGEPPSCPPAVQGGALRTAGHRRQAPPPAPPPPRGTSRSLPGGRRLLL